MVYSWAAFKEANERPLPPLKEHDISGRTVVVTGANTGIGYEIAKYMAKFGAWKIIAACRNEAKGQDAISRLAKETGRALGSFECWPLDFASMSSVRRFAQRYNESGLPLHIFIHNAGMNGIGKVVSEDGFDLILQVNYLAPALLSIVLYPVLARTGALDKAQPARFVWVTSEDYAGLVPFDESRDAHPIEALNKKFYELDETREPDDSRLQYFTAKLVSILAFREYARRIPPSANVALAAASPGLVATELGQKDVSGNNLNLLDLETLISVRPRTREQGARTIVLAATYPVETVWKAGMRRVACFDNMQEMDTDNSVQKTGVELRRKVWEDTVRLLKLTDDEVDGCFL